MECFKQFRRTLRGFGDAVSRLGEVGEQRDDALRNVEADRIAGAATGSRIVRHQHRDAALSARRPLQTHKRGDAVGHKVNTVSLRAAGEGGKAERLVFRQGILEGDGAGKHPSVELGQHHMHGEVGRAEAPRARSPSRAPRGGDHDLQHRRIDRVQRRAPRLAACGERRGGDDHRGPEPL
jgi:hypothetical protein